MKKLIAVSNHTIGHTYRLPAPIPSSSHLIRLWGTVSVMMFFYVLFLGYGFWITTSLGAIALFVATRLLDAAQLTTPELQPHIREEARLLEERKLALQKFYLEERIEALRQEGLENRALVKRLQALKNKMQSVNSAFYASRMSRVDRAVQLLQQRTQHDRHLIEQYTQTISMIEIELETAYLADQLPEAHDFSQALLGKLAELRALEDRNRHLQFELEANEEVRRLSGG